MARIKALETQMATVVRMLNEELKYLKEEPAEPRSVTSSGPKLVQMTDTHVVELVEALVRHQEIHSDELRKQKEELGQQHAELAQQRSIVNELLNCRCDDKTTSTGSLASELEVVSAELTRLSGEVASMRVDHAETLDGFGSLTVHLAKATTSSIQLSEKRMEEKTAQMKDAIKEAAERCREEIAGQATEAIAEVRAYALQVVKASGNSGENWQVEAQILEAAAEKAPDPSHARQLSSSTTAGNASGEVSRVLSEASGEHSFAFAKAKPVIRQASCELLKCISKFEMPATVETSNSNSSADAAQPSQAAAGTDVSNAVSGKLRTIASDIRQAFVNLEGWISDEDGAKTDLQMLQKTAAQGTGQSRQRLSPQLQQQQRQSWNNGAVTAGDGQAPTPEVPEPQQPQLASPLPQQSSLRAPQPQLAKLAELAQLVQAPERRPEQQPPERQPELSQEQNHTDLENQEQLEQDCRDLQQKLEKELGHLAQLRQPLSGDRSPGERLSGRVSPFSQGGSYSWQSAKISPRTIDSRALGIPVIFRNHPDSLTSLRTQELQDPVPLCNSGSRHALEHQKQQEDKVSMVIKTEPLAASVLDGSQRGQALPLPVALQGIASPLGGAPCLHPVSFPGAPVSPVRAATPSRRTAITPRTHIVGEVAVSPGSTPLCGTPHETPGPRLQSSRSVGHSPADYPRSVSISRMQPQLVRPQGHSSHLHPQSSVHEQQDLSRLTPSASAGCFAGTARRSFPV
eukprot:TRINITY_DN19133_c0_g1_i1.p1 TRINITY_DN19133_c0_g1~~TRINITY_DN19133_c0_g1_i1.p1  ORF type:complete len:767 (-),score=167.67 TRINITY_DN19133_c0_g1_i1:193-2421(-)